MAATEYILVDSNSNQLLYIGPATLTRTAATAPSRGTLAVIFMRCIVLLIFLFLIIGSYSCTRYSTELATKWTNEIKQKIIEDASQLPDKSSFDSALG